jgi:hypothetical protein
MQCLLSCPSTNTRLLSEPPSDWRAQRHSLYTGGICTTHHCNQASRLMGAESYTFALNTTPHACCPLRRGSHTLSSIPTLKPPLIFCVLIRATTTPRSSRLISPSAAQFRTELNTMSARRSAQPQFCCLDACHWIKQAVRSNTARSHGSEISLYDSQPVQADRQVAPSRSPGAP